MYLNGNWPSAAPLLIHPPWTMACSAHDKSQERVTPSWALGLLGPGLSNKLKGLLPSVGYCSASGRVAALPQDLLQLPGAIIYDTNILVEYLKSVHP